MHESSLHAIFQRLTFAPQETYRNTPTPTSLEHKYVAEDVPTGVLPTSTLGRAAGVATPVLDGLVHLSYTMVGQDFAAEARTLDRLGLANKNVAQIQNIVQNGFARDRRRCARGALRPRVTCAITGQSGVFITSPL